MSVNISSKFVHPKEINPEAIFDPKFLPRKIVQKEIFEQADNSPKKIILTTKLDDLSPR